MYCHVFITLTHNNPHQSKSKHNTMTSFSFLAKIKLAIMNYKIYQLLLKIIFYNNCL